jgi:hypothetical protein
MAGAVSQIRLGCRLGAFACYQHAGVPLRYYCAFCLTYTQLLRQADRVCIVHETIMLLRLAQTFVNAVARSLHCNYQVPALASVTINQTAHALSDMNTRWDGFATSSRLEVEGSVRRGITHRAPPPRCAPIYVRPEVHGKPQPLLCDSPVWAVGMLNGSVTPFCIQKVRG